MMEVWDDVCSKVISTKAVKIGLSIKWKALTEGIKYFKLTTYFMQANHILQNLSKLYLTNGLLIDCVKKCRCPEEMFAFGQFATRS
jgi:hypothetical protein